MFKCMSCGVLESECVVLGIQNRQKMKYPTFGLSCKITKGVRCSFWVLSKNKLLVKKENLESRVSLESPGQHCPVGFRELKK